MSHADGDRLVRVDLAAGRAAQEALDLAPDQGHARLTTDQQDLVELVPGGAGLLEDALTGLDRAIDQVFRQLLELAPLDLLGEVGDENAPPGPSPVASKLSAVKASPGVEAQQPAEGTQECTQS